MSDYTTDDIDEGDSLTIADPEQGFKFAQVRDWIILDDQLPHTAFRVYAALVAVATKQSKFARRLTKETVRRLVPGVNGKEMGKTALADALRALQDRGLLDVRDGRQDQGRTKKGEWAATSWRFEIRLLPPNPDAFTGWRSVMDKLDAIHAADDATQPAPVPRDRRRNSGDGVTSGNDDEHRDRNSDRGRNSGDPDRNSGGLGPLTSENSTHPYSSSHTVTASASPRGDNSPNGPALFDVDADDDTATGDRFEEFWDAYDDKGHSKKSEARDEWVKRLKAGASAQEMITGAAEYARERYLRGTHSSRVRHAVRWLAHEEWKPQFRKQVTDGDFAGLVAELGDLFEQFVSNYPRATGSRMKLQVAWGQTVMTGTTDSERRRVAEEIADGARAWKQALEEAGASAYGLQTAERWLHTGEYLRTPEIVTESQSVPQRRRGLHQPSPYAPDDPALDWARNAEPMF